MKHFSLNKVNFRHLVLGVTAIAIFLLTLVVAFISSKVAFNEMSDTLYHQGINFTNNLVKDSVAPLLYDSTSGAVDVLETLVHLKQITNAKINRLAGDSLAQRKKEEHVERLYLEVSLKEPFKVVETKDGWYFSALVISEIGGGGFDDDFIVNENSDLNVVLGTVQLGVSKNSIYASQKNIFIQNAVVSMTAGMLLLVFLYIILRNITRPLEKLSALMEQGRKGEYPDKAQVHGTKEISEISHVFNEMIFAIKEREQNLSLTLDSIGDAVIVTDASGSVVRMNPVAEKLTGWLMKDATGMSVKEIFPIFDAATRAPIKSPVDKVLESGETVYLSNHTTLIAKDKTEYQIADSAAPIRNEVGEILGMVLVFNDVTEHKKQEEQLRRSQKMDALGKLTGGVAHDYNNMLGVVMGYANILKSQLGGNSKHEAYAEKIIHAGERGAKLTKKLLAFSSQKKGTPDVVNLNEFLLEERDMLEKVITARIDLTLNLEENLRSIYLDEGDLEDAIVNLCINAMHAIKESGHLTISTSNQKLSEIDAKALQLTSGDYVVLSVTDNGCGMNDVTKDKIFEPFYTTKGGNGTGLGLTQVYGFVERSAGVIQVYSELGQGTEFVFYFPSHNGVEPDEDMKKKNNEINFNGNESILIVDDESALLDLTCEILNQHGYKVVCAANAKQAIELLKTQSFDLLFTDIIMPEINGYQLAALVKKEYPQIKIQLVSGFSDAHHADMVDDELHANIIQKPYQAQVLLKKIREIFDNE